GRKFTASLYGSDFANSKSDITRGPRRSFASILACPLHVCLPSVSDRRADILDRQLRARKRHMHCSIAYSITSSARASRVGGTSRPSALAVFRLIANSYLVGCSTGRSAGFAPLRILST